MPNASPLADDATLVRAAVRGDEQAFEALYQRHRHYVLSVAVRFGADPDGALDVLQETFLYFLRKLPGFELRSQFRTFLYPAAKNLALKRGEKGRRHPSLEDHPEALALLSAPNGIGVQRRKVAEYVAALPEAQREVVMLRFVDGFRLGEIAEALGVPQGTVKSRLHHALAALRGEEDDFF